MPSADDLTGVLRRHLADPEAGWCLGAYGAIAEFLWDARDPPAAADTGGAADLAVVTATGGLAVRLRDDVRPVAYESLSARPERWLHGVLLCLPEAAARVPRRNVLTELGPDRASLRAGERGHVLFDLGLGTAHTTACVRTGDRALIEGLRAYCGRSILAEGRGAFDAILAAHPHRVFISALGRIEVYQRIGHDEDGGRRTLEGPHTHVLPELLAEGRTHAPDVPVPAGWVPCLALYPGNPLMDRMARPKPFDAARHAAFQDLLARWGDPAHLRVKAAVRNFLRAGRGPDGFDAAVPAAGAGGDLDDSARNTAVRVALRQARQEDGDSEILAAWREVYEREGRADPMRPGGSR